MATESDPPKFTSEDEPIDRDHLRRMTLGDEGLEREVLDMFLKQAAHLFETLLEAPPDASARAHTLTGSARAVGAFRVADRAGAVEALIGRGEDASQALAELGQSVAEAIASIKALLRRA
jgi:HPt (histidine-containing phosphotransfer) domain-containing protein